MREKVENLINDKIKGLNLYVSDVNYLKENNDNYLKIELDSDLVIDVELITKASNIINKLLDTSNFISEYYILDIYSKEKGEANE